MTLTQPQDIFDAKGMARKLRTAFSNKGIEITASESLETLAFICGFKDWNTLSGKLKQSKKNTPNALDDLSRKMGLCEEDPDVGGKKCWDMIAEETDIEHTDGDMWNTRAKTYFQAVFSGVQFWCRKMSVTATPQMIQSALHLGTGRFCEALNTGQADTTFHCLDLYRWMLSQDLEDEPAFLRMKSMIDTIPGFSLASLHAGADQSVGTREQVAFLTMQITRSLEDHIDRATAVKAI